MTIRVTARPTAAAAAAARIALRGNDTWLRLLLLTFQTRHCDKFFYSDFRNRKTISLNKHLMQGKGRGKGFPSKYSVEERKVSAFVASLPTLATSRARHK